MGEHSLEIQTQYPSGCFDIPRFDTDGFGICYKNVSNVIARLGSKHRKWHEEHSAVLINCHYDTWPTSYGKILSRFQKRSEWDSGTQAGTRDSLGSRDPLRSFLELDH